MATTIIINPASGDSEATLFSGTSAQDTPLQKVSKGTVMRVVGETNSFYEVAYDNNMPNETHGGSKTSGTLIAYPYAYMYQDLNKSKKIAKINNGTCIEIIDDSTKDLIKIKAFTTEGNLEGYVEPKYIYRDLTEEEGGEVIPPPDENGEIPLNKFKRSSPTISRAPNPKATSTGTVNSSNGIKARTGPGDSYKYVGAFNNKAKLTIYETKNGWHKVSGTSGWGQLTNVWVSASYVTVSGSNSSAGVSKNDATKTSATETPVDRYKDMANSDFGKYFDSYTAANLDVNANDEYYQQLTAKYVHALGAPPRYNMDIDIQYIDEVTPGRGRVQNRTLLSNPTILSICPGSVTMFPNLIGTKKDAVFEAFVNASQGNDSLLSKVKADEGGAFSGKLYSFKADTANYSHYVNALCRASAILLGIGDMIIPNTTTKLKHFDYSYWTIRKKYNPMVAAASDKDTSLFRNFWPGLLQAGKRIVSAAVDDTMYLNFFMNGSETSVAESIQTSITDSPIQQVVSTVSSAGAMLNYFTGSGFDISDTDVTKALEAALGSGSTLSGIMNLGENFLKGGRMVLPKMVEGASYGKSISCNLKFMSPYGDRYSVFMKCIVPICHLLAMALPKQLSDNMYTFPFLIRAAQLGLFNVDLGVISSLNITRGGNDDTSWTVDNMATEWDVQMEITPLVDELMVTGANHPVLFCKNEMLLDYLANYCGFDVLANQAETKVDLMLSFVRNSLIRWPHSLENKITDSMYNKLNSIFTL